MDEVTYESKSAATPAFSDATWETVELRRTIARTQEAVARLDLRPSEYEAVNQSLDAASGEAAVQRPDRYTVGEHLEAAAHVLEQAGALDSVADALRRATELLGPAGLATVATAL
jgi:hypothetical protein